MSGQPTINLEFGGELRTFGCGLGVIRRVQDTCDAGPGEIARRLAPFIYFGRERDVARTLGRTLPDGLQAMVTGRIGDWRVDDIREPIYQGLIFGGATAKDAAKLVRDYIDESREGLLEALPTAFSIVNAMLMGVGDETAGESARGQDPDAPASPAENSGSTTTDSTPSAPPPGSPPAT